MGRCNENVLCTHQPHILKEQQMQTEHWVTLLEQHNLYALFTGDLGCRTHSAISTANARCDIVTTPYHSDNTDSMIITAAICPTLSCSYSPEVPF